MTSEEIIQRLLKGDPIGLAKAITRVENRQKDYKKILAAIYPIRRKALKLGITGSPGSGKSTLAERLIAHLRKRSEKIGVLAVDPSSPISGGALLGDRIRMIQHSTDPDVYIRSMASRGYLGGLSAAAFETIDLMIAAGKETILIETVGVGQSEIDVVALADMVLTVLTPSSGDEIQMFKAGLIEITDIFVVNKADQGGAETKVREIENYFFNAPHPPSIVTMSARDDVGVSDLVTAIDKLSRSRKSTIQKRRQRHARDLALKIVQERIRERIQSHPELAAILDACLDQNIYLTADRIYERLCPGGKNDPKN